MQIPGVSLYKTDLFRGFKICVKRSFLHRWGVFALVDIKQYELLEETPYFLVPKEEANAAPSCSVYTYGFCDENLLIGTGCACLYNHSYEPNAAYELDAVNQSIRHYALKDIEEGSEITINYGEDNAKSFLEKKA
jgi:SET domain-containing protein